MAHLYRFLEEWEFNNLRYWSKFRNLFAAAMIDFVKNIAIAISLLLYANYKGAAWGLRLFNYVLRLLFVREELHWQREYEEFIGRNAMNRFLKF